jgi:hypothetical protein
MDQTAECCCSASKMVLRGEQSFSAICHCSNCKKRTGSAFGVSVYFEEAQLVSVTDTTNTYSTQNENGSGERHFCSSCGTTLYWRGDAFPNMVGVAGGCFTDPIPELGISAADEKRIEWVKLPESWTLC